MHMFDAFIFLFVYLSFLLSQIERRKIILSSTEAFVKLRIPSFLGIQFARDLLCVIQSSHESPRNDFATMLRILI